MKQKTRTASILLLIILGTGLVLMACGTKSLDDSSTGGSEPYGLNVESMTGTDSCQMELQESEVLLSASCRRRTDAVGVFVCGAGKAAGQTRLSGL